MKSTRLRIAAAAFALLTGGLLPGCISHERYLAERRQRLLDLYPLGATTRADVSARWKGQPALQGAKRPSAGWPAYRDRGFAERCLASERRTGKRVDSFELRRGADGVFSLCYCWFYYDHRDHLVDAEWQGASD